MRGEDFFVQIASRPPLAKLHPRVGEFFRNYLLGEKAVWFGDQRVVNTQFPPYPSRAFERLAEHLLQEGAARLYSVTLAVTNRCPFHCRHCYNAGRSQQDMPTATWERLACDLQDRGAALVTLTGGEPLLRDDLERICRAFDDRSTVIVGTTGWGLTGERARRLKDAGVFAVGISLDSDRQDEHDAMRRRPGAFPAALEALATARAAGLYPYAVAVANRELLRTERFLAFMEFAGRCGAMEVHLLEPSATGRLSGRTDVTLSQADRRRILDYQREIAVREDLPILSTLAYVESAAAFGCGAGLTHIYIDGSGELCPCNLVPLSFGNVAREPLDAILDRMGCHFRLPRLACVARMLAPHVPAGPLPMDPNGSARLCRTHLPEEHELPAFFRARSGALAEVGQAELRQAYDRVRDDYDDYWVVGAGGPVRDLVERLALRGGERVFEGGCGTGYGSALVAERLRQGGTLLAVDLSEGMIQQARRRLAQRGLTNVEFRCGDALEALSAERGLDVVFTSWVLGYIPLSPFFAAASGALVEGGTLAFVVHRDDSPREPLEVFSTLVARDPSVLRKRVAFDFPRDAASVCDGLHACGLSPEAMWEGSVVFPCDSPRQVLDHLLKSGAGTVFYDALDPAKRPALEQAFMAELASRHACDQTFPVTHEFIACVARKS